MGVCVRGHRNSRVTGCNLMWKLPGVAPLETGGLTENEMATLSGFEKSKSKLTIVFVPSICLIWTWLIRLQTCPVVKTAREVKDCWIVKATRA